MTGVRYMLRVC